MRPQQKIKLINNDNLHSLNNYKTIQIVFPYEICFCLFE